MFFAPSAAKGGVGVHFWHDASCQSQHHSGHTTNPTDRELILQRWNVIQRDLIPEL
jgi:hypothetical protein